MNKFRWPAWFIGVMFILSGCSGGNGDSPQVITGVAATGLPIVGTVSLKDSSTPAKEVSKVIAADGSFTFDLNGLTAPFILKAVGSANQSTWTLYSFSESSGIANINPLSNLAVVMANGSDLNANFLSITPANMNAILNAMPKAVASVQTALRPTFERLNITDTNFISSPYIANHKGLDLLLDFASITISNGTVVLFDKATGNTILKTTSAFKSDVYDFIANPVTTTGTLFILPRTINVIADETITLNAFEIGSSNSNIIWSVVEENGGSITSDGIYTAPSITGTYHVKATSASDLTKSITATVVVSINNLINLISSAPGVYTVMGINFNNIGGVEIEISYDSSALANPQITPGSLAARTMFIPSLHPSPNTAKFALMSLKAISGSGSLATISFDLLGAQPPSPLIIKQKLVSATPTYPTTPSNPNVNVEPAIPQTPGVGAVATSPVGGS